MPTHGFLSAILASFCLLAVSVPTIGWSAIEESEQQAQMEQLLDMDVRELAEIHLTSAARKDQTVMNTAAAVSVISQEEIRRSGMRSIPELLRMVPGLDVARINADNWAITSRGFNAQYSNKLLVLMDGRTLYTPLFAGVNWNLQDVLLEDVERIEVIRGPGGTVWGANAVNGVINIITKKAADTQGGLLTAGGGDREKFQGSVRYGGQLGDQAEYRIYGKGMDHAGLNRADGSQAADGWNAQRGGMRLDWHLSKRDELTMQGNLYRLSEDPSALYNQKRGSNVLARWTRTLPESAELSLQFYYDHTTSSSFENSDILDLDLQHRFHWSKTQEINWGLGFRQANIKVESSPLLSFTPPAQRDQTFSLFLQDEIALQGNDLKLTVGSKLEHNDYTGLEYQPSARLLWRPNEQEAWWAAVSRAIRTPARTDTGFLLTVPTGPTTVISVHGNPEIASEKLWAYELGYRTQPVPRLSLDVAAHYNRYDQLVSHENLPTLFDPATGIITLNEKFDNKLIATTYGLETAVEWQATDQWKWRASHTYLRMDLDREHNSTDSTSLTIANENPRHQIQLRSYLNLPHDWELDTALYYVTTLPRQDVPALLRMDVRLGWRPSRTVRLSLAGQNLFDNQHLEFQGTSLSSTEIPRTLFALLEWSF
ncbi:MAG: TonB-dependent receptor [Magnetococcales bacterium]|nr:TonB-dependent receptor [Magnetococcales bacterium]